MTENKLAIQRQKQLVEILNFLSDGGDFDQAKQMFG